MVVESLRSEKVRKTLLNVIFMSLGVIMLIIIVIVGIITGLLSIAENSNLIQHWKYVRTSLSEIFDGMRNDIDTDVKAEVYDFMPDFSINLSKATIGNKFDGNPLVLYDEDEIAVAQSVMLQYAYQLRGVKNEADFEAYMTSYPDDALEYTDIIKIQFTDDTDIENIDKYPENLQRFLYNRASEELPTYTYTFEETSVEGKPAEIQTLIVADGSGNTQTVEYTCIGGGQIYIPQILAMFSVHQMRDFIEMKNNEQHIAQIVNDIPETQELAEAYFEESWKGVVDGKGAINLSVFEVSTLCQIVEQAKLDGAVRIEMERTADKLSIVLETAVADIWSEVFDLTEDMNEYVSEIQLAIEMALDRVKIPVEERTLSLNNMVQMALFVYFEGFFEFPVDSSDLAAGTNGILSQYGDSSKLHEYNYGRFISSEALLGTSCRWYMLRSFC